jgi:hypothetical protein
VTKYLLALVLLLVLIYGALEAWPLIAGPRLIIESPPDNESFPGGIVEVRGRAIRAAELTLNGKLLLHEEKGDFSTVLALPSGGSILTFVATDRFGRRITQTRTIFVPE